MSTAIALIDEGMSFDEIARLTGQSSGQPVNTLPMLRINRDAENDNGDAQPVGEYVMYLADGPVFSQVYRSKGKLPVRFRAFINSYRYAFYDKDEEKYTNRSVIFTDFQQDAPDELGGNKCGKISKKALDGASADVVEYQKNIKCLRLLYGTVSFKGTKLDGTEVDVVDQPVLWQSGGSAFMPVGEALDTLTKAKRPMIFHDFVLDAPRREKQGSNVYYVPVMAPDLDTVRGLTAGDKELLTKFSETIKFENEAVLSKFKSANKAVRTERDAAVQKAVNATLDDDFLNDEVPL